MTDDDDLADKYVFADELFAPRAGWYEVSNWARSTEAAVRHNICYWAGADWWGVGPGAHSHSQARVGGTSSTRRAYAARLPTAQPGGGSRAARANPPGTWSG